MNFNNDNNKFLLNDSAEIARLVIAKSKANAYSSPHYIEDQAPKVDSSGATVTGMDLPTRPELDAKLDAIGAKTDARLSKFDADMRQIVNEMRLEMGVFRAELAPLKSLKANVWSATAVTVAAVLAAVAMAFGAFDSGRETAKLTQEAAQQSKDNRKLLDEIKLQLNTTAATAPLSAASK